MTRAGFVQLRLNHTKENVERAYSELRMTHAGSDYWRDYWKDATASVDETFRKIDANSFSAAA